MPHKRRENSCDIVCITYHNIHTISQTHSPIKKQKRRQTGQQLSPDFFPLHVHVHVSAHFSLSFSPCTDQHIPCFHFEDSFQSCASLSSSSLFIYFKLRSSVYKVGYLSYNSQAYFVKRNIWKCYNKGATKKYFNL
jgi:hypothetical protein